MNQIHFCFTDFVHCINVRTLDMCVCTFKKKLLLSFLFYKIGFPILIVFPTFSFGDHSLSLSLSPNTFPIFFSIAAADRGLTTTLLDRERDDYIIHEA